MARIVVTGQPGRLRKLRMRDLPADLNLSKSYLRWVDLDGRNLSAYKMEDMDIIDCDGSGVTLPPGDQMQYLMSRRTDWTGAIIPADVSSYNHDLVVEVVRQAMPGLSGLDLQVAQVIESYIGGSYNTSWNDGYWQVMDQLGLSQGDALLHGLPMFAGYSSLGNRLQNTHDTNAIHPTPPIQQRDLSSVIIVISPDGTTTVEDFASRIQLVSFDRHKIREQLRMYLRTTYGHRMDAWLPQLDPVIVLFVRGAEVGEEDVGDEDWYRSWPP